MTRPEPLREHHLGERKEGGGGEHGITANDDGAVVELGAGHEDRAQELVRQVGMDHHAGLGDLLEASLALEHDQGAVTVVRHHAGGLGDLAGHVLDLALGGGGEDPADRADPADPLKGAAQLRLEDDDKREQAHDGAGLEDLREQAELQELGEGIDAEQDGYADDEGDGSRAADQAEHPIDEQRRDRDVEDSRRRDLPDEQFDELGHLLASVTPGSGAAPQSAARPGPGRDQPRRLLAAAIRALASVSSSSLASSASRSSLSVASAPHPRSSYSSTWARWSPAWSGSIDRAR